jgi:2-oxoglutarate ferredoxin oxidoreductase subunit alpha
MKDLSPPRGNKPKLVQGNEACALGALYAGCNFYAGYPITPSSEIMEILAQRLPENGGVFIQMEDEISSMCSIIGAAWGGAKVMTGTSGPGFSLMQEALGYASITETPCVIVDCMRWGPSTGQPTKTAQGDVMQAIWGTHGDHPVIVLTAANVREVFDMTVTAFNYSERYRVPVILLLDEVLGHMRESVVLPLPGELKVFNRQRPENLESYKPFGSSEFLPFGEGVRMHVTGMAHGEMGFSVQGEAAGKQLIRMISKIQNASEVITQYREKNAEESKVLVISYGITARAAECAVDQLRGRGINSGLLDLKTLWPFPDFLIRQCAVGKDLILVPELNMGQVVREVERAVRGSCPVQHVGRVDGYLLTPEEIRDAALNTLGMETAEVEMVA